MVVNAVKEYFVTYAPEIMLGVGITSTGAAIYSAARGGMKAKVILDQYHKNMAMIAEAEELRDSGKIDPETPYTMEDAAADKKDAAKECIGGMVKAFAPAAVFGAIGVTCFAGGVGILNARVATTSAALEATALSLDKTIKAFDKYRGNVRSELGEVKDLHFLTGLPEKDVTVEIEDENGKKRKVKTKVIDADDIKSGELASGYQFVFGPTLPNGMPNHNWYPEKNLTKMFIDGIESSANRQLQLRGVYTINQVLEELGMPPTSTGAVTGWSKYDDGDRRIDFRTTEISNGIYLLDFNVDGYVADKIDGCVARRAQEYGIALK